MYCNLYVFNYFQEFLQELFFAVLDELDETELEESRRMRLLRYVPRDRSDPMAYLMEHEFYSEVPVAKAGVRDLLQQIRPRLPVIRNARGKLVTYAIHSC